MSPLRREENRKLKGPQQKDTIITKMPLPVPAQTKPSEDIDEILKEIGPHPVIPNTEPAKQRKGKFHHLNSSDFDWFASCLRTLY